MREVYQNVTKIIDELLEGILICDGAALTILNQRETTVVWDAKTSKPDYHAIVWQGSSHSRLMRPAWVRR
ncbi:MAG: hypothetical protein LBB86_09290 [Oscillospiraceae bacterium]|nr:hypothetical protein [Oscillospiraceae bacterium]